MNDKKVLLWYGGVRQEVKANCGGVGSGKRPYMPLFLSSTLVILEWQYQSHHRGPDVFLSFFILVVPYRILVSSSGIKPRPQAVKVLTPNHRTVREFPWHSSHLVPRHWLSSCYFWFKFLSHICKYGSGLYSYEHALIQLCLVVHSFNSYEWNNYSAGFS